MFPFTRLITFSDMSEWVLAFQEIPTQEPECYENYKHSFAILSINGPLVIIHFFHWEDHSLKLGQDTALIP